MLEAPSQTWRTFFENHVKTMVSVDFFTVPTIRFQVLYVFLVFAHVRRRILHFGVTAYPTADWTAQQLRDAFRWHTAPRYLLRDRDRIFGDDFTKQVQEMGIKPVLSAPRSPWQRAYVERVIGTLRRECLDYQAFREDRCAYRVPLSGNQSRTCHNQPPRDRRMTVRDNCAFAPPANHCARTGRRLRSGCTFWRS